MRKIRFLLSLLVLSSLIVTTIPLAGLLPAHAAERDKQFRPAAFLHWPVVGYTDSITRYPASNWTKSVFNTSCTINQYPCYDGHRGTDIPVSLSTAVYAAAGGTVNVINNNCTGQDNPNLTYNDQTENCGGGLGNYIRILHDNGYTTIYAHLKHNTLLVGINDSVTVGQQIADSGNNGSSGGPHLHFEVTYGTGSNVSTWDDPWGSADAPHTNPDDSELWVRNSSDQIVEARSMYNAVILKSPANKSFINHESDPATNIKFEWEPFNGAIHYQVEIDNALSPSVTTYKNVPLSSLTNGEKKVVTWRVRAVLPGSASDWSPLWSLNLDYVPITNSHPRVFPASVNGDDFSDLLAIDINGQLGYSLGDGHGAFYAQKGIGTTRAFDPQHGWFSKTYAQRVWAADITGEGSTDLVGINDNGIVVYALSNGNKTFNAENHQNQAIFESEAAFEIWFRNSIHSRVFLSDVDGDDAADFVAIADDGRIMTAISNKNGTFDSKQHVAGYGFSPDAGWFNKSRALRVWPTYVNQSDDYKDLIGIDNNGTVFYALSNGDGGFQNAVSSSNIFQNTPDAWLINSYNSRIWPADIDHDGDDDFLGISNNGTIMISTNDGNGNFTAESPTAGRAFKPTDGWFDTANSPHVWPTDLDGDKSMDLVGITGNGDIYHAMSTGTGQFGDEKRYENRWTDNFAEWFKTSIQPRIWPADIDDDNDDDIVGIDNNGTIFVAKNMGKANFEEQDNYGGVSFSPNAGWFSNNYAPRVWPADMDGDGAEDLVGLNNNGIVAYAISNKDGSFTSESTQNFVTYTPMKGAGGYFLPNYHPRIFVGDNNGDKAADFFGVNNSGTPIDFLSQKDGTYVYKFGSGAGFGGLDYWFTQSYQKRVWPAYVNSDEYEDMIGIDNNNKIKFMISTGTGKYGNQEHITGQTAFTSTFAEWFKPSINSRVWPMQATNDQLDDLVGIGNNGTIIVHKNNGDKTFTGPIQSGVAFVPDNGWFDTNVRPHVWPADLDGDGDEDFIGIDTDGKYYYSFAKGDGTYSYQETKQSNAFALANGWFD